MCMRVIRFESYELVRGKKDQGNQYTDKFFYEYWTKLNVAIWQKKSRFGQIWICPAAKNSLVKLRYSEKATKIWPIFHFLFDITGGPRYSTILNCTK